MDDRYLRIICQPDSRPTRPKIHRPSSFFVVPASRRVRRPRDRVGGAREAPRSPCATRTRAPAQRRPGDRAEGDDQMPPARLRALQVAVAGRLVMSECFDRAVFLLYRRTGTHWTAPGATPSPGGVRRQNSSPTQKCSISCVLKCRNDRMAAQDNSVRPREFGLDDRRDID
jgi:hypothetical protein